MTHAQPESVESFHARVLAAADAEGRLPLNVEGLMAWSTFPYATDGLTMQPVQPLAETDHVRRGEDPAQCWCATGQPWLPPAWENERWLLLAPPSSLPFQGSLMPKEHYDLPTLPREWAEELGWLLASITAAVEELPSVGRAHACKWGDGGAHLHYAVLGRPTRMPQLLGSYLPDWMDHMPELPAEVHAANLDAVISELVTRVGGQPGATDRGGSAG